MLKVLLRSSALVLLMSSVFSPLEAGKNTKGGEDDKLVTKPISSKKKEAEGDEEKEFSLSNALNLGLDIDENTALPKGWNLVDSAKKDINKPLSLKKKNKRVELLGDNYTFYTNVPMLKDFDKNTFLFSVELRSTNPGVYIQYYDGKNAVSSIPYASKKGEWETLNIEFTVDANAKFHRLYSAVLGAVKGNDKPSVDINSIKLQRKQVVEQKVVESEERAPELPPREKLVELPKKRALPALPVKKPPPSAQEAPSPEPAKVSAASKLQVTPKEELSSAALQQRSFMSGLELQGNAFEAAVKKARALVNDIQGTKQESLHIPYYNLATSLIQLALDNPEKHIKDFKEALDLYETHLGFSLEEMYELLQLDEQVLDMQGQPMPMARVLKENFKLAGIVSWQFGQNDDAIDRFETALAIIDDDLDYDPQEVLRGAALASWAEAKEDFEEEEYPIKAAAYFEAYFKLNPKHVDLDDYIKAAESAWEASKFPLHKAWETFKRMNSRLDVRYAIGEGEDVYGFMELSGPFVSRMQKANNKIYLLGDFFDQIGKEQPENEPYASFHEEGNKANHIYQAHMRRQAINWLAKVVDTKNITKQQISPELKVIYDQLRVEMARSAVDDSSVDLNPNGYVSYVKPDRERYINEAKLAIENESYNYASFLADQMVEKFPDQQGTMNHKADIIRAKIVRAKMEK